MELRWLSPDDLDAVLDAAHLFDTPPTRTLAEQFLASPNHHLCIAYVDDAPAGFVTGVEMSHPDKGSEMFLYELGVDAAFRGRGIATALVNALGDRSRERGCYGMWVLTDDDNEVAIAAYRRAGAMSSSAHTMLEWRF